MTHDGLPKILGPLLPKIREGANPSELRIIMTLLNWGRTVELKPIITSLDSITTPSPPYEFNHEEFAKYVIRTVQKYQIDTTLKANIDLIPMFGYGPNGPAMKTSI
jgi:hypothetical protein